MQISISTLICLLVAVSQAAPVTTDVASRSPQRGTKEDGGIGTIVGRMPVRSTNDVDVSARSPQRNTGVGVGDGEFGGPPCVHCTQRRQVIEQPVLEDRQRNNTRKRSPDGEELQPLEARQNDASLPPGGYTRSVDGTAAEARPIWERL